MSGFVGDLSPKQEKALQKFKENVSDVLKPEFDDHYILKWLRARHWDLKKSENMLRESLEYKKMMKLDELMLTWKDPEVMEKYFVGGLCGFDREGSPIWIDPFGYIDPKGIIYSTKSSDVIKSKLVLSETVQQLLHSQTVKTGHRVDTCIVIFDLDNVTITHIWKPFIDLYGKVLAMFEANYPETLKMCFITNAPNFFSVGYNLIKPFLSQDTRNKVVILGRNFQGELLKYIDASELPVQYGGTRTDENGDPKCSSKINYGGKVPVSYYLKDKTFSTESFQTAVVGRGAVLDIKFETTIVLSVLRWEFQTQNADIGFGIFRKNGESELIEVLPVSRYNCNFVMEDGQLTCDEIGTYIVRFDNSFSWIKSKKVKYIIELLKPDEELERELEASTDL